MQKTGKAGAKTIVIESKYLQHLCIDALNFRCRNWWQQNLHESAAAQKKEDDVVVQKQQK